MKRNFRFVIIVLLVLATSMLHPSVTHAATIIVQSPADDGTATPANCPGANCRLRDAIEYATADDTINFAGDYTINLTAAELTINKNLTIDGVGHTVVINGPGASCTTCFRVFRVSGAYTFNLSNLTVANGNTPSDGGGAIFSDISGSNLTITNVTFSGNSAAAGGAIYVDIGTTTIVTNSAFLNNSSGSSGGGILSYATLTVTNSTFSGNTALIMGVGLPTIEELRPSSTAPSPATARVTAAVASGEAWAR